MAETFQSFGINTGNQGRAMGMGDYEFLLKRFPPQVLKQFSKLAESGLFGPGGVEALQSSVRREGGLRRNRLARGLKQRAGRRLGPRSGVIDTQIANDIYAPSFAGQESAFRNLLIENQRSKLGGLGGIQNMLRFFQDQVGLEEDLKERREGPGFLDFAGPAIDIGALIFGGPGAAAATNKARNAISPSDLGSYGGFNF